MLGKLLKSLRDARKVLVALQILIIEAYAAYHIACVLFRGR